MIVKQESNKKHAEKANAVAISNRHYSMPNANAVRDVPHVCFCAKKAKTMMLWL